MGNKETIAFLIFGRIINRKTQQAVEGLRIDAWDKNMIQKEPLGSVITDRHGAYQLIFSKSYLQDRLGDRQPDLFFRIFQNDRLIHNTEDSLVSKVVAGTRRINIEVDFPAEEKSWPRLAINSLDDLRAHEKEILERIHSVPKGAHLFLVHPFRLLAECGVEVADRARREMLQQYPGLSSLSTVPYEALKKSKEKQRIRFHIRTLSHGRSL
jgi:hypothetical protein